MTDRPLAMDGMIVRESLAPNATLGLGIASLGRRSSGDFRPARVTDTFESFRPMGVEITTHSGRRVVSTPEHTHFAGYHGDHTPPQHLAYLMWRREKGFRVGTTRTRPAGQHPVARVAGAGSYRHLRLI